MSKREQLVNDINKVIDIYDCLLIETGGSCDPEAYREQIESIGRKCAKLTGNNELLVKEVDLRIESYSAEVNINWKYLDKMIAYLAFVKNTIRSL